jgi:PAS domain S-box-containing protein
MEKKKSIVRTILLNMILITIVSLCIIGVLWTWHHYTAFKRESVTLREAMLFSYQDKIKTQVQHAVDYIVYRKSLTEENLRSSIKEKVNDAFQIASNLFEKHKDQKTPAEIQSLIIESLRAVRFDRGQGYFFIFETDGSERLFSYRPEMEGKNLLDVQDSRGRYFVKDMIQLVEQKGEGFYHYEWFKPGVSPGTFPKIAFVKSFSPYNWVIGTGEYLEDVQTRIQTEILNFIETIRFGENGYIFVTQWDGLDLVGPAKGRNMLHVADVNGLKIVQEMIQLAKTGGGFLTYVMPKFKGMKPDPKLSYVQGIKDWKWYVGAGIYIDDIETAIEAKRSTMTQEILSRLTQVLAVLMLIMGFIYFYGRRISNHARVSFDLFTTFFNQGPREPVILDPDQMKYQEFESLAHSANQMIQARKQAQIALGESEKKYRLIVESISDLIVKLDREKELIFVSPTCCTLFGMAAGEILNQGLLPLIHKEDHPVFKTSLSDLDRPPYTSYREERVITKTGLRWLAWSIRGILGKDGRPEEYVAVGRDITDKKQVEEALRENQAWLQSVLDSIQAGVVVIDPKNHVILELNRAAAEMIGAEKEQIVNTICHNHICANESGMCPVTDQGMIIEQSDRELLRVDGTRIPILKTVNCETINGKEYLIESFLDLSEKKQLESMLLQAQKMEAVGTLAGGIAHDFNNILSPILVYSEMAMMDMPPDSPIYQSLQSIYNAGERARELVKQILTFARKREANRIPIRTSHIVQEVIKFLRSTLPSTITIQYDSQTEQDIVLADPTQLNQVVMNLCTNAAHAMMEKGGKLMVTLMDEHVGPDNVKQFGGLSPGSYLRMVVTDTGSGMSTEVMDKIFEPYFTTKSPGEGTGLGLAVVHGIVEKYNGDISIESRPGKGTTFHVLLPTIAHKDTTLKTDQTDLPKGNESILFVDDEEMSVNASRLMLERLGYHVTAVQDSRDALEIFRNGPENVDLVITDMTMPNMTGKELAKALIKIRPDIPIILYTGFSEQIDKRKAEAIGIKAFVMKPVVMRDMAAVVRKVLDENAFNDRAGFQE